MFGFFKRRQPVTLDLDAASIEAMFDEANSPEEREYERISEHTSDLLDTLKVDIKRRKFIWKVTGHLRVSVQCLDFVLFSSLHSLQGTTNDVNNTYSVRPKPLATAGR